MDIGKILRLRLKKVKTSSTLSSARIVLSLLIFAIIPLVHAILKALTGDDTISYTMALNLSALSLFVHCMTGICSGFTGTGSRPVSGDGLLYTAVGIVLISLWCYVDRHFLSGYMLMPDPAIEHHYFFAFGAIFLAFSFCQALIVNISFKCLTDHMDIRDRELLMILVSGFLFGLFYTIAFAPLLLEVFGPVLSVQCCPGLHPVIPLQPVRLQSCPVSSPWASYTWS